MDQFTNYWNDLTLSDKARMIRLAVQSGLTDLNTIHKVYNKFADGGDISDNNRFQTFQLVDPSLLPNNNIHSPLDPTIIEEAEKEVNNPTSLQKYKESMELLNNANFNGYYYNSKFPYTTYLKNKDISDYERKKKIDNSYNIPFIENKAIQIGSDKAKIVSTNMLDTLAKYGALNKVPIDKALGLADSETDLGLYPSTTIFNNEDRKRFKNNIGSYFVFNKGVNPTDLVNDHNYFINSYDDAIGQIVRNFGGNDMFMHDASGGYINSEIEDSAITPSIESQSQKAYRYADKVYQQPKEENPLNHAFRVYNSGNYNNGNSSTYNNIEKRGKILINDPEIQNWWNNEGYKWYNANGGYLDNLTIKPFSYQPLPIVRYADGGPFYTFEFPTENNTYIPTWKSLYDKKKRTTTVPYSPEYVETVENKIDTKPTNYKEYKDRNAALAEYESIYGVPPIIKYDDGEWVEKSTKEPAKNYIQHRANVEEENALKLADKYSIPYDRNKEFKLKVGKDKGIKVSTPLLDSLAKYAALANVPIEEALGLASRETGLGYYEPYTFESPSKLIDGEGYYSANKGISPAGVINYETAFYRNNPFSSAIGELIRNGASEKEMEKEAIRLDKLNYKGFKDENPLKEGFKFYKTGKWNPGEPGHTEKVKREGKILMTDPTIKKWWEEKGKNYYKNN